MTTFYGTATSVIAPKTKQVTVPRIMMDALGADPVIVPLPGCPYFRLYSRANLDGLVQGLAHETPYQARYLSRIAIPVKLDTQRRITVPQQFFNAFGSGTKRIVFVSAMSHVQLWPEDLWIKNTSYNLSATVISLLNEVLA